MTSIVPSQKAKAPLKRDDFIVGEAAEGVPASDVTAVNSKPQRELYADRQKIHPKLTHGTFRTLKWVLLTATLAVYYVLPWLRWDRGPSLPDQAILADVASGRIFLFGFEI